MSTFGKKALCWWDYNDHSRETAIRYQHTPNDLQLKILEMWYPVDSLFTMSISPTDKWRIKGYVKHLDSWYIDPENIDLGRRVARWSIPPTPVNPVLIIMEPETLIPLKRGFKLDRLFKK